METIVRNVTLSNIFIEDMGILLTATESLSILDFGYTKADLDRSNNLKNFVSEGDLVINDGTNDLSVEDALEHISIQSIYADDQDNPGVTPSGGTKHQILVKASDQNYDLKWLSVNSGVLILDPITYPLGVQTEERRWETLATYSFPGTIALGSDPTKLDILYKVDRHELKGVFRLQIGNSTVARFTDLQSEDYVTVTDETLRNLSDGPSIWEIQMKVKQKYLGYYFRVSTMTLRFD